MTYEELKEAYHKLALEANELHIAFHKSRPCPICIGGTNGIKNKREPR
jgi:hypothetical protein